MKCVPCKIGEKGNRDAYAYLCLDCTTKREEEYRLQTQLSDKSLKGIFMLVATRRIAKENLLSLYYTRNQVEDIFRLCKHWCRILPADMEKEETLRDHLLMTFMAVIVMKRILDRLSSKSCTPDMLWMALNGHRAHIFENCILVGEPVKVMNDIYKLLNIQVPTTLGYAAPQWLFEEVNRVGSDWLDLDDDTDTKNPGTRGKQTFFTNSPIFFVFSKLQE